MTGRILACKLNADHSTTYPSHRSYDVMVRWGSSIDVATPPSIVINRKKAISNSSNKATMMELFKGAGIATPKYYSYSEFASITVFPVVVRFKSHTQGNNFYICNSQSDVMRYAKPGYYALAIVDKSKEYRVFVWRNEVLEVNRKTKDNEDSYANNDLIRNFKHGWWFKVVKFYDERVTTQAIKAVKALGLDYGAADVCVTTDGKVLVFEVNSAPGLFERKAEVLAETIRNYVDGSGSEGE